MSIAVEPSTEITHVEYPKDAVYSEEPAAPVQYSPAYSTRELRVGLSLLQRLEVARHLILERLQPIQFLCCGSKFCRYSIWNEHHANDALFRVHTIIASEVRCHPREPARVRACLLLEGRHERELWQKESDAPVQLAASALPVGVQQGRSEPAGDPAPLYECPRPTDGSCCMRVSNDLVKR